MSDQSRFRVTFHAVPAELSPRNRDYRIDSRDISTVAVVNGEGELEGILSMNDVVLNADGELGPLWHNNAIELKKNRSDQS